MNSLFFSPSSSYLSRASQLAEPFQEAVRCSHRIEIDGQIGDRLLALKELRLEDREESLQEVPALRILLIDGRQISQIGKPGIMNLYLPKLWRLLAVSMEAYLELYVLCQGPPGSGDPSRHLQRCRPLGERFRGLGRSDV